MEQGKERAKVSVSQAAKTGSSLQAITEKVESISHMNMQIASATERQQQTAKVIQNNVVEIKKTADSAVNSAQQVEQVSVSLREVSSQLQNITSQFKV